MDNYKVSYHGYAHSHIDALCHILYRDQTDFSLANWVRMSGCVFESQLTGRTE